MSNLITTYAAHKLLGCDRGALFNTRRKEMLVAVAGSKRKRFDIDEFNRRRQQIQMLSNDLTNARYVMTILSEEYKITKGKVLEAVFIRPEASAEVFFNRQTAIKTLIALEEFMPLLEHYDNEDDAKVAEIVANAKIRTFKDKEELMEEFYKVTQKYVPFVKRGQKLHFKIYGEIRGWQ